MRAALWLLALFGIAVAGALLAGNNQGMVTLFWAPYRLDLSINLVVLLWGLSFALMHLALRALAAFLELPHQARRWRAQQKERNLHAAVLEALALLMSGRYLRARKSAEQGLELADSLQSQALASEPVPRHLPTLRALAHLIAAESAHVLHDHASRDLHFQQGLAQADQPGAPLPADVGDAARLSAARWALSDRDASAALEWLTQLPHGTARRTLALRLRLKAARLSGRHDLALDTTRLLSKHGAFSPVASESLLRSLILARVDQCHDSAQLTQVWSSLDRAERLMPDIALSAARRLLSLQGSARVVLSWLLPLWTGWGERSVWLDERQQWLLIDVLEQALQTEEPQAEWLARTEQARLSQPQHMGLLYLYGRVCMRHSLWGKAQQMLERCAPQLTQPSLQRKAWCALAELAQQRGDEAAAAQAWRRAALATG
jgi:HemY protein